jgi:hypothetical protein
MKGTKAKGLNRIRLVARNASPRKWPLVARHELALRLEQFGR